MMWARIFAALSTLGFTFGCPACGAGTDASMAADQPAEVMLAHARAPAAQPGGSSVVEGDLAECASLLHELRQQAEAVSRAYEDYETSGNLEAFALAMQTAGERVTQVSLVDRQLGLLAVRYRQALVHQVEGTRRAASRQAPVMTGQDEAAFAEEGEVMGELAAYCGSRSLVGPLLRPAS
jgi:hypothetical protein